MSKQRNRNLNHLIRAILLLLCVACSASTDENCLPLDLQSIIASWDEIRPSSAHRFSRRGFRMARELHTNIGGQTFANVQFGAPEVEGCRCCDTLSFEEVSGSGRLVSVVSVRRARSAADAIALADSFWEVISAEKTGLNAEDFDSAPHRAQLPFEVYGSSGFVGEILVAQEEETGGYVVRMYVSKGISNP